MDGEPHLTRRQAEILQYILDHLERHGQPPLLREIADACGHTRQAAHLHIRELRLMGAIHPAAIHEPRNIHVTALASQYLHRYLDKMTRKSSS
jgi:SOS-response transcriptional repressor LexA